MKIKAIIFDLYNTLIQAEEISWKPYFQIIRKGEAQELKKSLLTRDYFSLEDLFEKYSIKKSKQIDELKNEIEKVLETARFFPETLKVLNRLREEDYLIGIISNLSSAYKKPFFTLGLNQLVDYYIFSCEAGIKKPDKKIFKLMISALNIRSENALMIGDSLTSDYQGARNAGLNALLLDRENKSDQKEKIANLQEVFSFLKAL